MPKGAKMEYMFAPGFLGTKAPFFMDFVTIVVALLPFLVWFGVILVRKRYYSLHAFYQITVYIVSILVVGWFEYGVRTGGGFNSFIEGNPRSPTLMLVVLIAHIIISTATTIYWGKTLWQAYRNYAAHDLPGGFTVPHKGRAKLALFGILLTSLTGIWVYLMLFVY
jgi:putative membrane protein